MDVLKTAGIFIGSFLGAGFVSGVEVEAFFGGKTLPAVIMSALVFAAGFLLTNSSLNSAAIGISYPFTETLKKFFSLMSLAVTLAVSDKAGMEGAGFPQGAVTGAVALALSLKERKSSLLFIFSVAAALTSALSVRGRASLFGSSPIDLPLIGYSLMSALVPGFYVAKKTKNMSAKKLIITAVVIFVGFFTVVCVFMLGTGFLSAGEPNPLSLPVTVSVFVSALTSATAQISASADTSKGKTAALAAALLISPVGIENMLKIFYPVMIIISIILTVQSVINANKKVLVKRRKN